ncbi:MAG TPA: dihydrolipoyllysine-residue succinyltransferase [Terriglobia bacterium]|nr:dihydrolipoyllysine-residue succinyltransferase [Terriglobia bacterium]
MPTNVIMPQMGESVAEGTVTKWMKKVGDRVERDEPLFEISTDKVDAEIPSPAAGVLTKILVAENQTVEVNTVVAEIDGEGAAVTPSSQPAAPAVAAPSAAPVAAELVEARPVPPGPSPATDGRKIRSSPLVRRIAKENQVDLALVSGSGLAGRISKNDILAYVAEQSARAGALPSAQVGAGLAPPRAPQQAPPAQAPPPPQMVFTGPTQVVPMTPMRQKIAEHMVLSKRTSAHVHTVFEVEMTKVFEVRAAQAAEFERRNGVKLTFTPFFVRAALEGIKQFPILNSSVDGTNIIYKREVNMGIAVALETGLIVPVIKRADEKNFLGVARAVTDLAERARSKRLSVDEVQGGTFTITNPGIFGSLFGTPIINQPQVAILGVGAIEKRAVVRNDAIAIRPMVYLALSFDHRIIDGAVADQFMVRVKTILENWSEAVL